VFNFHVFENDFFLYIKNVCFVLIIFIGIYLNIFKDIINLINFNYKIINNKMLIRKGDKFLCTEDVNNVFGFPLFEKNKEYKVLCVNNEKIKIYITLNHILYSNEYIEHDLEWISKRFKKIS
jgi:hypothetical protein